MTATIGLLVTNALAGNPAAQLSAAGSIQGALAQAQAYASGVVNDTTTQALSDVAQNGIALPQMTDAQLGGALQGVGSIVGAHLGAIPRIITSVGIGAASGALVGGPYGAALGAAAGIISSLPTLLGPSGPRFSTPDAAQNENLGRLQNWQKAHPSGLQEPLGWHFYDYIAATRRTSGIADGRIIQNPIQPICTAFLFGGDPGPCNDFGGFQGAGSTGSLSAAQVELETSAALLGRSDYAQFVNDMANRMPDPAYYACLSLSIPGTHDPVVIAQPGKDYPNVPPSMGVIGCPNGICGIPDYGGLFALGTIVAMLATGASDQSIAAELLLQQNNLVALGGPNEPVAAIQALTDVFLRRLPTVQPQPAPSRLGSVAMFSPALAGSGLVHPAIRSQLSPAAMGALHNIKIGGTALAPAPTATSGGWITALGAGGLGLWAFGPIGLALGLGAGYVVGKKLL